MAARNPGPFLQQTPLGFPSFNQRVVRDAKARKAFRESEVNTRIYKAIYENVGLRGDIPINKYVGRNRIRVRGITEGSGRGARRWTQMNKWGFSQAWREGWFQKYGIDPDRFH
mmetsp:Transcript_33110/g.50029  ORF Transcript_33110/g.50029 Transcript_33110/m.50029 type:complete len:113 (-) Transcript_33110:166-504(-)